MFDVINEQVTAILSYSIGGLSGLSILGSIIYAIKQARAARKEKGEVKEIITSAFKETVLPKNIRLDVSGKIIKPIEDGMTRMEKLLNERLVKDELGIMLILTILKEFSHVQKLPISVQQAINDYLDAPADEIKL